MNLISDIGGQFGLWAGFSLLSVVEVVELILLILAGVKFWRGTKVEELKKDNNEEDK